VVFNPLKERRPRLLSDLTAAQIYFSQELRALNVRDNLRKSPLVPCCIDERERAQVRIKIQKHVHEQLQLGTRQSTVDQLQLVEMQGWHPREERLQTPNGVVTNSVLAVDDRLKALVMSESCKNRSELGTIQAAIFNKELLDASIADKGDGFCECADLSVVDLDFLENQRLVDHLFNYRLRKCLLLLAFGKDLPLRTVLLHETFADAA